VFFTVALAQRGSNLLIDEIDRLRDAVRLTRVDHPFVIDAWVVLPDHMHAIWTLPASDRSYGVRWGAIKSRFSRSYLRSKGWPKRRVGFDPTLHIQRANFLCFIRFGSIASAPRRFLLSSS